MKTSRLAVWTAVLIFALAICGGLGMGRKARAQTPVPPPPPSMTIPIPDDECVHLNGDGNGTPGRNGLGILGVPLQPSLNNMILQCQQLGYAGVHATLTEHWITEDCPFAAPPSYQEVAELFSSVHEVKRGLNWDWEGTPIPYCITAPGVLFGVAEGFSSGYLRPHGNITLTCCSECPPGIPGGQNN